MASSLTIRSLRRTLAISTGSLTTISPRIIHSASAQFAQRPHNSLNARKIHSTSPREDLYPNATIDTFNRIVNTKDRLVLVDFYANWCQPCKLLSPILEEIASDSNTLSGSKLPVDLVAIDTDEIQVLAQKYKIRSLPTVIAFRDGVPVDQFIGAVPKTAVNKFLMGV